MITNAQLRSIAGPPLPDGSGGYTSPTALQLIDVRCFVDQPSRSQQISNEGRKLDFSEVMYVPLRALAAAPQEAGEVVYVLDGVPGNQTRSIMKWFPRIKDGRDGLSHYELWLKAR